MSRADASAFVAGGTVQAGGGVYLERRADAELLEHCRAGDFSYILTSRQMGKSSLMIRTAERLVAEGALPVIVDLTEFGAQTSAEQWYKGFLAVLDDQLSLRTSSSKWWAAQSDSAFGHRFIRYLREVALAERSERLVIFVDEIDTTLRLDFTDDFFTSIRFLYQQRAADPAFNRLSFVLIGVATPGDLIKDTSRTPFNIGHRIELTDFTIDEAAGLADPSFGAPIDREGSHRVDASLDGRAPVPHAADGPLAGRAPAAGVDGSGRRRARWRAVLRRGRRDRQQPSIRARHADEEGVQPRSGARSVRAGSSRRTGT